MLLAFGSKLTDAVRTVRNFCAEVFDGIDPDGNSMIAAQWEGYFS